MVSGLGAATSFKGAPVRLFQAMKANALSDTWVDCRGYNAVHVQVIVTGTSPSVTLTMEGSDTPGGLFLVLPDPNATQRTLAASASYEVNVGASFVKARLASISGTYAASEGYTVIATPFISAGSRQRPNWWDRNATPQWQQYAPSLASAPEAFQYRFTYTVPAGRKAILANAHASIMRATAATTPGTAIAGLNVTIAGTTFWLAKAWLGDNTVGSKANSDFGQGVLLNAGDGASGSTWDSSTGGTVWYLITALVTEFDV